MVVARLRSIRRAAWVGLRSRRRTRPAGVRALWWRLGRLGRRRLAWSCPSPSVVRTGSWRPNRCAGVCPRPGVVPGRGRVPCQAWRRIIGRRLLVGGRPVAVGIVADSGLVVRRHGLVPVPLHEGRVNVAGVSRLVAGHSLGRIILAVFRDQVWLRDDSLGLPDLIGQGCR